MLLLAKLGALGAFSPYQQNSRPYPQTRNRELGFGETWREGAEGLGQSLNWLFWISAIIQKIFFNKYSKNYVVLWKKSILIQLFQREKYICPQKSVLPEGRIGGTFL